MNGAGMDYDAKTATAVAYATNREPEIDPFSRAMEDSKTAGQMIEKLSLERAQLREQVGMLSKTVSDLTERLRNA